MDKYVCARPVKNYSTPIVLIVIGLLYIFMPSINHSGDTFGFAVNIRDGEDLFLPHHLLYNAFYFLLAKALGITATLPFICLMNALFAVGCLCFMNAILSKFLEKKTCLLVLITLGFCFGFLRYATTGEVYIIPLFFSLWASWLVFSRKNVFLVGLIAALACLFHQVHFFWWIGLLYLIQATYKENRFKVFILYGIASCIVPIVYLLVFYLTDNDSSSIFEFIVHDYVHAEDVEFSIKTKALLLTPISFFRTFYQVHGYMFPLIEKFRFLAFFLLSSVILGIIGCYQLKHCFKRTDIHAFELKFAQAHLIIFILQLIFAFISNGNAEFMVMLPFALSLFVFIRYRFRRFVLYAFSSSLIIWNLVFGVIPSHYLELTPELPICKYIKQHPDEVYYVEFRQTVSTKLRYEVPDNTFQVEIVKMDDNHRLDSLLQVNQTVITDILTSRTTSRASFARPAAKLSSSYNILEQDTVPFDLGILVLSRIEKNDLDIPADSLIRM